MAVDEVLVERMRNALDGEAGLSERNMFGGVAFMIHGNMACGVQKSDLVVRVGPDAHEAALADKHARPMDFTGRPMKGYVYVEPKGFSDKRKLTKWLNRGVTFARTLPKKAAKKKVLKKKPSRPRA